MHRELVADWARMVARANEEADEIEMTAADAADAGTDDGGDEAGGREAAHMAGWRAALAAALAAVAASTASVRAAADAHVSLKKRGLAQRALKAGNEQAKP